MPPNLYGERDHFHIERSHVISATILKMHKAKLREEKEVEVWGTGKPKKEFLFTEDFANACIFLMNKYESSEFINVGNGEEISIRELAYMIKEIVGYEGEILFNAEKPDGMPRKIMDSSKMAALGWRAKYSLQDGIKKTYDWFLNHQ